MNGTKHAFVPAERANHAVATLCWIVGVSMSGFYAWLRAIPTLQSKAEAEAELRGHIGPLFAIGMNPWRLCSAQTHDVYTSKLRPVSG
jgi:hypothetical protein